MTVFTNKKQNKPCVESLITMKTRRVPSLFRDVANWKCFAVTDVWNGELRLCCRHVRDRREIGNATDKLRVVFFFFKFAFFKFCFPQDFVFHKLIYFDIFCIPSIINFVFYKLIYIILYSPY